MTEQNKSKRKDGEGSIYQLENGKWVGKLHIGTKPNGKPDRKTFSGKTEAEIKRKIKEFNKNKEKYLAENVVSVSLQEYMRKWLYDYKKNELKDSSFDRLEHTVEYDIIPHIGMLQLGNVQADDIQIIINKLFDEGKSLSVIKKVRDACNGCFKYAIGKRDIKYNPTSGVNLPSKNKFKRKEIQTLNSEEMKQFENEATRQFRTGLRVHKYGYVFILLLNTGLRRGEVLGINKYKDIDLENNLLHVRNSVSKVKIREKVDSSKIIKEGVILQDNVKTDAGNRIIPINKKARIAIEYLIDNPFNDKSELLISSVDGNPVHPDRLNSSLHRLLDNIPINRFGSHVLRHTFASRLFEKGIDVKVVSEILGHATISITYDTYIHLIKEQKVKAIQSLDFDEGDE